MQKGRRCEGSEKYKVNVRKFQRGFLRKYDSRENAKDLRRQVAETDKFTLVAAGNRDLPLEFSCAVSRRFPGDFRPTLALSGAVVRRALSVGR